MPSWLGGVCRFALKNVIHDQAHNVEAIKILLEEGAKAPVGMMEEDDFFRDGIYEEKDWDGRTILMAMIE